MGRDGKRSADQLPISALRQWLKALTEVFWRGAVPMSEYNSIGLLVHRLLRSRQVFFSFNPTGLNEKKLIVLDFTL